VNRLATGLAEPTKIRRATIKRGNLGTEAMKIQLDKRGKSASTLIETVIATGILVIMAAAILGSINYGLFVMRLARENQRATQILLERTEAVRLYSWDQVTNGVIPTSFTAPYDPQSSNAPGIIYTGTMAVAPVENFTPSYAANMRQFTITLDWTTADQIPHSRSLTTLIAKDGIQNYVY
jgi:type II secretory pathway pseudopilin PulG